MEAPEKVNEKIKRLIEKHFRWDDEGFTDAPDSEEERKSEVEKWLEKKTSSHQRYATVLVSKIKDILGPLERKYAKGRFFCRIDDTNLTKSPESILEKMARKWKDEGDNPPIDFENLHEQMSDLGRFRLAVNFLSDAELIVKELKKTYGPRGSEWSKEQQALKEEFRLVGNTFEDQINKSPKDRSKGERCYKGVFKVTEKELKIEVQITTLLQEAWDKKDHFLIYEPRRAGHLIPQEHEQEIYAMSEMLFVADLAFERLKKAREQDTHTTQEGKEA